MILLVLLVYEFGRRWFGGRAGLYSGLIFATSFGVFLNTRSMIAEPMYALAFTAVFYLFLRAWEGSLPMRPACWTAAVITALAVLARGLIGVIFPVAGIVLFLLATGGWRRWRELPWLSSTLIFLAVAVPWHVIVGSRVKGFYWFYFINEHFLRAVNKRTSMDYQPVPRLLWWAEHLIWFFPWSVFVYFGIREWPPIRLWRNRSAALAARGSLPAAGNRRRAISRRATPAAVLLGGIHHALFHDLEPARVLQLRRRGRRLRCFWEWGWPRRKGEASACHAPAGRAGADRLGAEREDSARCCGCHAA